MPDHEHYCMSMQCSRFNYGIGPENWNWPLRHNTSSFTTWPVDVGQYIRLVVRVRFMARTLTTTKTSCISIRCFGSRFSYFLERNPAQFNTRDRSCSLKRGKVPQDIWTSSDRSQDSLVSEKLPLWCAWMWKRWENLSSCVDDLALTALSIRDA